MIKIRSLAAMAVAAPLAVAGSVHAAEIVSLFAESIEGGIADCDGNTLLTHFAMNNGRGDVGLSDQTFASCSDAGSNDCTQWDINSIDGNRQFPGQISVANNSNRQLCLAADIDDDEVGADTVRANDVATLRCSDTRGRGPLSETWHLIGGQIKLGNDHSLCLNARRAFSGDCVVEVTTCLGVINQYWAVR